MEGHVAGAVVRGKRLGTLRHGWQRLGVGGGLVPRKLLRDPAVRGARGGSARTAIRQGASVARGFFQRWFEASARRLPWQERAFLQELQHWFSLRPGSSPLILFPLFLFKVAVLGPVETRLRRVSKIFA